MSSYSSSQTLGKSVSKAKKNLPSSPRKKAAVVRKLLLEVLPDIAKKLKYV